MNQVDATLAQVLVAAGDRRAPVTPETAGYIALALADTLSTSPSLLKAEHVALGVDGAVLLTGSDGVGEPAEAERRIRFLLGQLLGVSVGVAPALAACAKRREGRGVPALVKELESALIPVNRSAARRAIGRLAREAQKASSLAPAAPASVRPSSRPISSAPRAVHAEVEVPPSAFDDTEPLLPAQPAISHDTELTDIDAPVIEFEAPPPVPRRVAPERTPALASYEPHRAGLGVDGIAFPETRHSDHPVQIVSVSEIQDPSLDELVDVDPIRQSSEPELMTYEPPDAVSGDELDLGTAAPPIAEMLTSARASERAAPKAEPSSAVRETGPDRVDELLAEFGSGVRRSSGDVAGELKGMLGLPPTPPPPSVAMGTVDIPVLEMSEPPPPVGQPQVDVVISAPRRPRMLMSVSIVLLVLALVGLMLVYLAFPQLLIGR